MGRVLDKGWKLFWRWLCSQFIDLTTFRRMTGTILLVLDRGIVQRGLVAHCSLELRVHKREESRIRTGGLAKLVSTPINRLVRI